MLSHILLFHLTSFCTEKFVSVPFIRSVYRYASELNGNRQEANFSRLVGVDGIEITENEPWKPNTSPKETQ